jgi:outer membrane protein assembly factor BamB
MWKYKIISSITLLSLIIFGSLNLTFAQLADSPWPMFMHDPQHTGRSIYNGPSSPILKWQLELGTPVYTSVTIGPDRVIYICCGYLYVYSINLDGTLNWIFDEKIGGVSGTSSSPAIGVDRTIYVGSSIDNLFAINPNGTYKWSFLADWYVDNSPAIAADGTIYVGSADDYLYAISPDSFLKWKFQTEDSVESSPAIATNGTIYIGSNDYYLYAINPDGSLQWKFQTEDNVESSPAIAANGTIYVGSNDSYLYAINPDGSLQWKFKTGGKYISSTPAIGADGTIYLGSFDSYLYAINPDGSLQWKFQTGDFISSSPAIGANGTIYFVSFDSYLYAINPDGSLQWKFQTWSSGSSPIIGEDKTIYIGSTSINFYAIGESQDKDAIEFGLNIDPEKSIYQNGDNIKLLLEVKTPSTNTNVDLYFVMLNPANTLYFGMDWNTTPTAVLKDFTVPANLSIKDAQLLEITIPSSKPPIGASGSYTFAIGATEPNTLNFLSNIATISFEVK